MWLSGRSGGRGLGGVCVWLAGRVRSGGALCMCSGVRKGSGICGGAWLLAVVGCRVLRVGSVPG
ncbi:hypothetical protein [Candidatus Avelusimicrobium caledoniensis]|uniref:hypothetical protein n=1 Tax=Candidatus Avelusimicrobium caledoniensis TaxID=3416220 RepID=UPI003D11FEA4